MGGDAGQSAAVILTEHQRLGGGCSCGWDDPDQTHPQHVLHQLQLAGLDVVWR